MELVIGCAVQSAELADQRLFNQCGVADLVQRVQGDSGSDECGGSDKSIQGCDSYTGPDLGGEILRGWK